MYSSSTGFKQKIVETSRKIYTKATFNNQVTLYGDGVDGEGCVVNIKFMETMEDKNGITIGTTGMNQVEMTIRMPSSVITLNNGYVKPYVGLEVGSSVEYIPLGKFNITDIKSTNNFKTVDILAVDDMLWLETDYVAHIPFPAKAKDVLQDIVSQCNISIKSGMYNLFSNDLIIPKARADSCRTYLSYIAGLIGRNARFDRAGQLEFIYYSRDDDPVLTIPLDIQYMDGTKIASAIPNTVNSITSGDNTTQYTYGSGVGIVYHCPDINQTILNTIGARIVGLTYTPLDCKWRGTPCIQCGDKVSVINQNNTPVEALVMSHTLHVDGGMYDIFYCYDTTQQTYHGYTFSPTTREIQKVYTQLEQALAEAASLIDGARGGIFSIIDSDGDGVNDGFLLADNPDPTQAHKLIRGNYQVLGFFTDGGHTYNIAITPDGIDATAITSGTIDASMVNINGNKLGDYINIGTDQAGHPFITIGASHNQITLRQTNDKIGFYDGNGRELAFFSNNSFEIVNLNSFRLDELRIQKLADDIYGFVKVVDEQNGNN